ncbi:MAG TPA: hypothetical protein VFQ97_05560 [Gallionella sp.]|nr:hypothetical protein [Gallionella sp.]
MLVFDRDEVDVGELCEFFGEARQFTVLKGQHRIVFDEDVMHCMSKRSQKYRR